MTYLAEWYDPELEPREGETKERLEREERERLTKLTAIAAAAQQVPRRLGADASSDDLAEDKKRCKRIGHAAGQCLGAWGGAVNNVGDISREAAQVDWTKFWATHETFLINRMRYIATWALKDGDEIWAKSALVKLSNEMRWLKYAMR